MRQQRSAERGLRLEAFKAKKILKIRIFDHAFHDFTIAQTKNSLDQQGPECYTDIQGHFTSTMAFEVAGIL